jgi:hypothetical protein
MLCPHSRCVVTEPNNVLCFRAQVLTEWRLARTASSLLPPVKVTVTLRLAVYDQPVRLGVSPLRLTTRDFFFN